MNINSGLHQHKPVSSSLHFFPRSSAFQDGFCPEKLLQQQAAVKTGQAIGIGR